MSPSPEFEIGPETETPTHWSYDVTLFDAGRTRTLAVRLSFQDYDHWSRGRVPPVKVVDATLRFALARMPVEELGEALDCSTVGRRFGEFETELPAMF
ncbi:MAG: hypothetical protein AAF328_04850 [Planctomycetota bacterium]